MRKVFGIVASLLLGLGNADDKISCWPDSTTDAGWDSHGNCGDKGSNYKADCDGTMAKRCPVTQVEDETPSAGDKECGECVTITYTTAPGGAKKIMYGKVVGIEVDAALDDVEYKVSASTFAKLGGQANCGGAPITVVDTESRNCGTTSDDNKITCWPDSTANAGWDPASKCGTAGTEDRTAACGLTTADRCPVTMSDDDWDRLKDDDCGECVTISYGLNQRLYGKVVGVETGATGWEARVNEKTYAKLGGTGTCGTNTVTVTDVDTTDDKDCGSVVVPDYDEIVQCWPEGTANWDPAGVCNDDGTDYDDECGTTTDRCAVTAAEDDDIEGDDKECNECVIITYASNQKIYGKVVGMEANQKSWDYKVNQKTFTKMGGAGNCGTGTVKADVDTHGDCSGSVPPPTYDDSISCWDDTDNEWDPAGVCSDTGSDYEKPCGTTTNRCAVTIADDDEITEGEKECNECVVFSYAANQKLYGKVVGMEANIKNWEARVNKYAFAKMGGSGACGSRTVKVDVDDKDGDCSGSDTTTTTTKKPSGAMRAGCTAAIAVAALGVLFAV